MMKTTLAGCFLAVTMLAGLLMASFAIAPKKDRAKVFTQAAYQRQLVEGDLQPYAKALLNPGQCSAPKFSFYVSVGHAKASLDMGQCCERLDNTETREAYERLLRDYADQSDQVDAARTRLAALSQPTGRSNGPTIVLALIPVTGGPVRVLKTLRSAEPQIVSDVTDLGIPSWLYCRLHPRWCKNL